MARTSYDVLTEYPSQTRSRWGRIRQRLSDISRRGLVLVAVVLLLPFVVQDSFALSIMTFAGIAAIAAMGLNVLFGYTGLISLGHAFFVGAGAYCVGYFGSMRGLPLIVWLPLAFVVGFILGAVLGPIALRFRGPYLVLFTLALVFLGQHIFRNWETLSGGLTGLSVTARVELFGLDFADLSIAGMQFSRDQGYYILVWFTVVLVFVATSNLIRSRSGRAMQAVRDRDTAAALMGIRVVKYKVLAFAYSGGLAAVAGGLLAAYVQYITPSQWDIWLSVEYLVIVIVGGTATRYGAIVGALIVGALPHIVDRLSPFVPYVGTSPGEGNLITVYQLTGLSYALLIATFLLLEPRGLVHLAARAQSEWRSSIAGPRRRSSSFSGREQ